MDILNPYYLQIVTFILINAILGISIYITLSTGQMSLGNAGFMSLGAYASAILTMKLGLPLAFGIFTGGVLAALVALLIGLPTTRLQGLYLAIATLGFGEVIRVVALNLEITNGALGISGIPSLSITLGKVFNSTGLAEALSLDFQVAGQLGLVVLLLLILICVLTFQLLLEKSRIGRAFAAIKEDEHAAEVMGVNVVYYKMLSFIIGAFVAGLAGALYAHSTFFINPTDFSYHKVVDILLYAVFGGSNVIWGPVLGAFILTLLPEVLRFMADYRAMLYGALLVIMMVFRPNGILSRELAAKIGTFLCFGKKSPGGDRQ
ncbi:MAG: branched-chain amino acid ABC transporter permease [Acidaminococcaceae bacterium]|nr:branched-chain amino acid ABC transporter permease [Acidaminococcaceae bacterium]